MQTPITYGAGPYEVTYIDAFGRLCSARYQFLDGRTARIRNRTPHVRPPLVSRLKGKRIMEDLNIPNLDCMTDAELTAFVGLMRDLADYATAKGSAQCCHLAGSIARAVDLERRCDAIYDRLPAAARW